MPQIFVSHSQHDKEIRASFDSVFARTGVRSVCIEFERLYPPAWQEVKNQISASSTVFLLLGTNVESSVHTQNWIAFEVGLACAYGKDVWVFEQVSSSTEFPIPYLTDYMIYDFQEPSHFQYVRKIIEGYEKPIPLFPLNVDHRIKRDIPTGQLVLCTHENCGSQFLLHTDIERFTCPSCRQQLSKDESSQNYHES